VAPELAGGLGTARFALKRKLMNGLGSGRLIELPGAEPLDWQSGGGPSFAPESRIDFFVRMASSA